VRDRRQNIYIDPVDLTAAVEKAIPVILRKGGPASPRAER